MNRVGEEFTTNEGYTVRIVEYKREVEIDD